MKKIFKSESGLTLIELLAATVIIAILLTGFFSFFSQGALFSEKNEDEVQATQLARQVLEELRQYENPSFLSSGAISSFSNETEPGSILNEIVDEDGHFLDEPELTLRLELTKDNTIDTTNLYIVKVEILNQNGQVLTDTYGYLEGEE
ncbi:type IV pilus modification PilV family protein [Salinibacillus xinjiangensis]|uniref:Prepilin-type N-terminal cleavage/methylation domain-containing protein n=1 Tax=Salinibacillus xinjiangensis TaxID=1229268 RepID=A0A6G1X9D8_9BACI|nr:type II secretion system protein [Salinibacillus xinjiangensis]MRG87490.1 prepilin-type N-terminal cleavage/methylation domain-containing protein [Salinibacillus xinjiangensis]